MVAKKALPLYMPTASSLDRAERCPTSFTLARVISTDENAMRGTAIHKFLSNVLGGMPSADALAQVMEKETRATCAGLDIASMVGDLDNVRSEVSYAFDTKTRAVRELGVNLDRAYETSDNEIAGTCDAEGIRLSGIAVTGDMKSGFADKTDPLLARQLHFHAVARRRVLDVDFVEARVWRVGESGKVKTVEHTFDGFALDEIEDDIDAIFAGVREAHDRMQSGETLQVSPGDHCRFCQAKPVCPSHAGLAREMIPELERVGGLIAGVMKMSPAEQFRVFEIAHQAQKLLDEIMPRLKAIAKHAPFVSEDGTRVVKVSSYEKESFSRELALLLLREKGATADELAALYSTITIEAVRMSQVKAPPKPKRKPKAA